MLAVHLYGTVNVARSVYPRMLARRAGAFCTIGSELALCGDADAAHYAAAKGAIHAFTKSLAVEAAPHGIRVNCVAPDVIMTPRLLAGRVVPPEGTPPGEEVVLGRWGRPEDIAGPLVFLLSELSSFMTGRTLVVDGGSMVHFPHGLGDHSASS
jgi:NAD(P)-dependent dehydrogenase (short-subunit alcohol dehydrogenase family)